MPQPTPYAKLFTGGLSHIAVPEIHNNGILYSRGAMPQKEINTDGTSNFTLGRRTYEEQSNFEKTQTVQQVYAKKWIGGNRDGSSVIERRRTQAIGKGSTNNQGKPISNKVVDNNQIRQALIRTRNGGSVVPPKCLHLHSTTPVPKPPRSP